MSYFYTHFDNLFHTGGLHNRTEDLKLWRKPASTVCLFEPNPTHCTIGSNAIQSSSLTDCIDLIRRIRVQAYLNRLLHNKIIHVYSCAFFFWPEQPIIMFIDDLMNLNAHLRYYWIMTMKNLIVISLNVLQKCNLRIYSTFFIWLNVMMAKYLYNKPKCSLIKFLFFISKIRI